MKQSTNQMTQTPTISLHSNSMMESIKEEVKSKKQIPSISNLI